MIFLVNDKALTKSVVYNTSAEKEIAAGARVVTADEWDAFKTSSDLAREKALLPRKPIYKQRAKKET